MSCNLVSTIQGNECIGDSRDKINSNFAALQSVVCSLSTNSIVENDTDTIDLTFIPSTRVLFGGVKTNSIDDTHLKSNAVGTSELSAQAVTTAKIALSAVTTQTIANSAITAEKMSGGQTGSAPVYGCRAWVHFSGTRDTTGAVAINTNDRLIRGSGNIYRVQRLTTGQYVLYFTMSMPTSSFTITGTCNINIDASGYVFQVLNNSGNPYSLSSVRVATDARGSGSVDLDYVNAIVFC